MQDYRQMYEEKKKTPEELAKYFKSGDVVGSVAALTEATTIMDSLCDRAVAEDLTDADGGRPCYDAHE